MVITLQQLQAQLLAAAVRVNREVEQIVTKGAQNVKTEAARNAQASSGRMAPHYPATINYDVTNRGTRVEAEIGPTGGGQARLGSILEYGSRNNPPHRDLGRAADTEEPRFISAMEQIGDVVI
jgi:hypothetical protein